MTVKVLFLLYGIVVEGEMDDRLIDDQLQAGRRFAVSYKLGVIREAEWELFGFGTVRTKVSRQQAVDVLITRAV